MTALVRVGHKGADLIEPGNTRASFDAALAHGVDMIELDVLPERGGSGLIVAHDYEDAAERTPLTLREGLEHLAEARFEGVGLIVDLKLPGYELPVLESLADAGLTERSLISTQYRSSHARIREADPSVRLAWSIPRARRDYTASRLMVLPALAALVALRRTMPRAVSKGIRGGDFDAVLAHWRLVTPRLAAAVRSAGGDLYVWTVDDRTHIRALEKLGVTGVVTNDPRLFAPEDLAQEA